MLCSEQYVINPFPVRRVLIASEHRGDHIGLKLIYFCRFA